MDPITFTVTPRGSDQAITIDLSALLTQLQTVPDQRKRRGVRYPLAVLLAIAVLAKFCGDSQVHALADWAHARCRARRSVQPAATSDAASNHLDTRARYCRRRRRD